MTNGPSSTSLLASAILAFGLCWTAPVSGQSTYSPYSRFGLGHMQSGASAAQMGMGQMGAAWTDRSHLNTLNPAAAAFLTGPLSTAGSNSEASASWKGTPPPAGSSVD